MLDAWDSAILDCFEEINRAPTADRTPCTLRLTRDCVRCLDETLARLRPGGWTGAGDGEQWALRSAAIEVATRSYVDGVKARRSPAVPRSRRRSPWDGRGTPEPGRSAREELESLVCALPRDLIGDLDALAARPSASGRERPVKGDHLMAARSVVVESAVTAWLILRGYGAVPSPRPRRGALALLRDLLRR